MINKYTSIVNVVSLSTSNQLKKLNLTAKVKITYPITYLDYL